MKSVSTTPTAFVAAADLAAGQVVLFWSRDGTLTVTVVAMGVTRSFTRKTLKFLPSWKAWTCRGAYMRLTE